MRVSFVGHACHLVEIDGIRVITDPWLSDPCFAGHCEHDPPLGLAWEDLPPVDVIAISHGHLDHFNAPTLARIADKRIPVVHPPVRFTELDANLRRLGFENCHPRADFEAFEIGSVRVVPTPSLGVLDECAFLVEGRSGRFWNGADAPQPPPVIDGIARRFGPIDLGAFSHNSFDQPALLGLPSFKDADHGPRAAVAAARRLGVARAFGAASNLRWCGESGEGTTRRVIRRASADFLEMLEREAPEVQGLDLRPGDSWSKREGIERGALRGRAPARDATDYIHAFLGTGERWSPPGRPSTEDTFRRDLPARTLEASEASRYLGQAVAIEVTGADPGLYTVDFREPGAPPKPGDGSAPYALRVRDEDWKDLFERRISWQVLLMSDRLAVTRVQRGAPPRGLHFAYALQAIFP